MAKRPVQEEDKAAPQQTAEEGLAHLAGDVLMPEVDAAAEWDVLEDFPSFTEGQWASVDGAGLLEIVAINQSAQGRLTVRNHGTQGNQDPGTVVYAGTAIALAEAPPDASVTNDPDFVWVGHAGADDNPCWTPKDNMRPVRAYAEWLSDGFRYLTYRCDGCQQEVHSTLWGFWLEDARPFMEGGLAAPATEVMRFGG